MSWIADFDAGSREMPTLVHVTRVTGSGFLQGETYVPIIDTHKLRNENAKLRELVREMYAAMAMADYVNQFDDPMHLTFVDDMRELGIEVD